MNRQSEEERRRAVARLRGIVSPNVVGLDLDEEADAEKAAIEAANAAYEKHVRGALKLRPAKPN
jgi:hypothetical protein